MSGEMKKILIWILCFSLMLSNVSVTAYAGNIRADAIFYENNETEDITTLENDMETEESVSTNEPSDESEVIDKSDVLNETTEIDMDTSNPDTILPLESTYEVDGTSDGELLDHGTIGQITWNVTTSGKLTVSGNGNPSSKTSFNALTAISTVLLNSSKSNVLFSVINSDKLILESKHDPPAGSGSSAHGFVPA